MIFMAAPKLRNMSASSACMRLAGLGFVNCVPSRSALRLFLSQFLMARVYSASALVIHSSQIRGICVRELNNSRNQWEDRIHTTIGPYAVKRDFHSSEVNEPPAGYPTFVGSLPTHPGISN